MEDESSKMPGHRTAVVRDQSMALLRRERENLRITERAYIGFVCRLEINTRLSTPHSRDNLRMKVGVSLEADGHWRGVSRAWRICSRRWNRAGLAIRVAAFRTLAWTANSASACAR
jgi:hypothetical protein